MRVAIRPRSDGNYQALFTGRFFVVIPFMYRATLSPQLDGNGNVMLSANKPLGFGMGEYRMRTWVTGNRLQGSFSAARDRGTVSMRRVR
jgi:hypothetical protein